MAAPRTLLVVNPQSQNGALGRKWPELGRLIRRELGSFEESFTRQAGDATTLTRAALRDGVEMVVAIGGDGTINEVVNGFFEDGEPVSPDAALGILPYGTGGDFRKTALIPKDMARASAILARFKTRRIDVGRLDYSERSGTTTTRMFVNIASFGISGEVDEEVNAASKWMGGRLTFMLATAKVGLRYEPKRVRLVFDGDDARAVDTTINTLVVANGRYFGGGMFIAPNAELDDGLFDVVSIGDMSFAESIRHGRRLYKGTHLGLEKVHERRARRVHAESIDGSEVLLDVDGEAPGMLPATFTIVPQSLKLVVP
jgi:YegS/Rv2252/BmrU family lipid kinase